MGLIKIIFSGDIMCKKEFIDRFYDGTPWCFDATMAETT